MNMAELLYQQESYKIRGACYEVYNSFGGAFKESIIQNALVQELKNQQLEVEVQKRVNISYKGKYVGVYIPDIIINSTIVLELKSKSFITREDRRQFWYYLRATSYRLGFLINFSPTQLEIDRRVYDLARTLSA